MRASSLGVLTGQGDCGFTIVSRCQQAYGVQTAKVSGGRFDVCHTTYGYHLLRQTALFLAGGVSKPELNVELETVAKRDAVLTGLTQLVAFKRGAEQGKGDGDLSFSTHFCAVWSLKWLNDMVADCAVTIR